MISSWLLTLLMDSKFKGIQNLMLSWPRVHIKLYIYIYMYLERVGSSLEFLNALFVHDMIGQLMTEKTERLLP